MIELSTKHTHACSQMTNLCKNIVTTVNVLSCCTHQATSGRGRGQDIFRGMDCKDFWLQFHQSIYFLEKAHNFAKIGCFFPQNTQNLLKLGAFICNENPPISIYQNPSKSTPKDRHIIRIHQRSKFWLSVCPGQPNKSPDNQKY